MAELEAKKNNVIFYMYMSNKIYVCTKSDKISGSCNSEF